MDAKGVVFEGKTLDDAVKKGLSALGLPRAEVMITVEEEGAGGFLGIGSRPYRVRMMPRPRREMPDRAERPAGRGREGRRDSRERPREPARADGRGREGRGRREYRGESREGRERENRNGRDERPPEETTGRSATGADRGERAERGERGRGRRGGRGREGDARRGGPRRDAGAGPRVEPSRGGPRDEVPYGAVPQGPRGDMEHAGEAPSAVRELRQESAPPANPAELTAEVQRLSEDLFKAMGFEARVSAQIDETDGSTVAVRAEVPADGELLAGEKGEVRQALQHLLNRMLNRGQVSRHHVQLEINDFWRQREGELQDLARQLAEEALAEGTEKLTEYLNAQERRIVHVTLREDTRVRTYAIGDGLIKKVAVAPADHPEEQGQEE